MTFTAPIQRMLDLVRAREGAPSVQFTPGAVRGGNILYYWQWAFIGRQRGNHRSVLRTEHMSEWLEEFPALEELTSSRSDIGILDRRTFATRHHFGSSFTPNENREFSRWMLEHSPSFRSRVESARRIVTERTCVINVRRGDYYSVPEYRSEFAIDIRSHVAEAIAILRALDRWTDEVLVVSDDPGWCRENLLDLFPSDPHFVPNRRTMFDDLASLAAARSLILANSTFSYWGSFLANAIHSDHVAVAPPFHQRVADGGFVSDLFDPVWRRTSMPPQPGLLS